jgi:hypothetical protein
MNSTWGNLADLKTIFFVRNIFNNARNISNAFSGNPTNWIYMKIIATICVKGAIQIIRDTFFAYFRPPPPCDIWSHGSCPPRCGVTFCNFMI